VAERKENICTLCSLGCGLLIETDDGDPVALDYRTDYPVNEGALCAKGNYALELLNHRMRLVEPMKDGRAVDWAAAAGEIAQAMSSPGAALIVEGDMSDEEAALLAAFGNACLPTGRVAVSFSTNDDAVIGALGEIPLPRATIDDLKNSACTIAVNDPFSVGPVVARWIMQARNAARENSLNVIAASENLASKFAAVKLIGPVRAGLLCMLKKLTEPAGDSAPGWAQDARVELDRLGPDINEADAARLAEQFIGAQSGVIVLSTSDPTAARLAACCSLAGGEGKKLFLLNDYGNAAGVCGRFRAVASTQEILAGVAEGSIDSLLVLGADLVASYPELPVAAGLEKLKFLAAGAAFANKTTQLAHIALPTAIWLEKDGTFCGAAQQSVAQPAGGARGYGEIIEMIAHAMNMRPAEAPAVARELLEINTEFVAGVISAASEPTAEPAVASSATRFADGSLTDPLSWPQALKTEA